MEFAIDRKSIIAQPVQRGAGQALPCLFGTRRMAPDTEMYDYNPDRAKALIAQSGVDMGVAADLTFDTYYNDPLR